MKVAYLPRALKALEDAPDGVRKAFFKQVTFLERDLRHPSLHAKKYDESKDRWQARVNRDWRFYFNILGDTYIIRDVVSHPK
jgi:mRNA-degrading endonuclease RelE of RelBE toxin-antitoxin system